MVYLAYLIPNMHLVKTRHNSSISKNSATVQSQNPSPNHRLPTHSLLALLLQVNNRVR